MVTSRVRSSGSCLGLPGESRNARHSLPKNRKRLFPYRITFLSIMAVAPLIHLRYYGISGTMQDILDSSTDVWEDVLLTQAKEKIMANTSSSPAATPQFRPETQTASNDTLVILMGDLRCGEPCWESLKTNVLDVNQADLALLIQPPKPHYQNASLFDMAKYHWPVPHYDNWLDALDIIMNNSSDWHDNFFQTLSPIFHRNIVLGPIKYKFPNETKTTQFGGSAIIICTSKTHEE